MRKVIDLTGQTFKRLTVLSFSHKDKHGAIYWKCLCECGNFKTARGGHLKAENVKSCGCWRVDRSTTHGMSRTPAHFSWIEMIKRCRNKNHKSFKYYGARGITVCDRWLKFQNFFTDMGKRPKGMSIERIDNDKGYSPDNCKWATRKEQMRNTRGNTHITYKGKTQLLIEWAEELDIEPHMLSTRLRRGWSVARALTTK